MLYKKGSPGFDDKVRKDPTKLLHQLCTLQLQEVGCLPSGKARETRFQVFMRRFFFPSPTFRPLARTLAQHRALGR